MTVVGLLMAGWSSFNKYSLLGGLRSAAQVVSYEIPLTLSVVGLILLAGTMSVYTLAETQSGGFWDWFVFRQPLGALIFFIAATAEANRTPFDLTEADSEIVAGFATEYSGMRFGFLFFAEYVNVFIISALMVTFYFGAWHAPFPFPDVNLGLDLGSLGIGLLLILAMAPVVLTLLFALPFWLASNNRPAWQALVLGFLVFNRRRDRPRVRRRVRRAGLGRRARVVHGQIVPVRVRLRLDAGHAAPGPDRSADGLRLEVAVARGAPQPVHHRGGHRRRPAAGVIR